MMIEIIRSQCHLVLCDRCLTEEEDDETTMLIVSSERGKQEINPSTPEWSKSEANGEILAR